MSQEPNHHSSRARQQHSGEVPGFSWFRRLKMVSSLVFSTFIVCAAVLFVALLYMRSQALPVSKMDPSTEIIDIHGEILETLNGGKNSQIVELKEISPYFC